MTSRQCEIAAEAYAASLLARSEYDVSVQYGANQPHYDLVAENNGRFLPISVKGSQDGGWMLAVKYKNKNNTYHDAINDWLTNQRTDTIYLFVQFKNIKLGNAPRVYIAKPLEIANHMKTQCHGLGHGALQEDIKRDKPKSKYNHKIPSHWVFSKQRIDGI